LAFLRKYRLYVAGALLVIFAFVVAPVQLWHRHHENTCSSGAAFSAAKHTLPVAVKKALRSDNCCEICAHKYAAYEASSFPAFQCVLSSLRPESAVSCISLPEPGHFRLSDRGPPIS
jgi:hypothetical protein